MTSAAAETQRSAGVLDRQAEQRHQARIDERGDLRDGVTIQTEHEHAPGAERLRLGVKAVDGQRWLTIGTPRHQAEAVEGATRRYGGEELGHGVAAGVAQG